jgi:hypothetical protein
MVVKCAFRYFGHGGDLVDAAPRKTPLVEGFIGGIENLAAGTLS